MDEVLKLCIALDRSAERTFARMAKACPNPELAEIFTRMSAEETEHIAWWTTLLDEWNAGLIPQLADEDDMLAELREVAAEIGRVIPADVAELDQDAMLEVAMRMEFFMLDPLFGELLELLDPGTATDHQDEYAQHVIGLTDAIEKFYSHKEIAPILAKILSRTFRDRRRLATLAVHDPLTSLYNRRGFYGYLTQWAAWAERYERPLAVLLADVDYFKHVNDTYGHPVGDEVLTAIAEALGKAVRKADVVGRYGGDEFAILAPETDVDELVALMERALSLVRGADLAPGKPEARVTISIGGGYTNGKMPVTPEQLLAAADESLYKAKAAGRNRAGSPLDASRV